MPFDTWVLLKISVDLGPELKILVDLGPELVSGVEEVHSRRYFVAHPLLQVEAALQKSYDWNF